MPARIPGMLTAAPAGFQNDTAVIQVIPKTGPGDIATLASSSLPGGRTSSSRSFRTILVPVKRVLDFLLCVAAVLGAQVALFQWGWGEACSG